jgi:hypothetical protein
VSSIVSGHVRSARLLRFIFAILIVDRGRERRYSVRIRRCCDAPPSAIRSPTRSSR